ncbi:MAG: metal ABC transporter substrate-binding protein [Spirochaetaceae bacterium]|jgi:zinc transport system substrate-binding protein|nr:metal ABC transporter substrate-binding protein [Spirochaetaceae bacterium]
MKRVYIAAVLVCVCAAVFAGGKKAAPEAGKLTVQATIFAPYDFARAVAGDRINLSMLLPPGAESHSFEPTPRDIINIQNSGVFIYIGGESDAWVDRILDTLETRDIKIVRLMDVVDVVEEEIVEGMQDEEEEEAAAALEAIGAAGEEPEYDEHIWTSPQNAVRMVNAITDALCEKDAANAPYYRQNRDAYIAKLNGLDAAFQSVVDAAKRRTIVFGDRFPFRYFADRYGLSYFAAFPGCSTETEPSAATVAFLIDKIKAEKIPVVFHIELSNERMADTIAEETGAKKRLLHAAHNISKRDFDRGATYLELMTANVDTLREALQ